MKILFVAPRFHTNQFLLIKTLLEKKHEVFFHVACIGATEDHSLVTPVRYRQSILSLLIEKILGKRWAIQRHYFPQPLNYWKEFKRLKPEIVVIRDPYKLFSLMAAFYAFFTKAKIVFYTQEDVCRIHKRRTLLKKKFTIRFFKAAWMTPIKSTDEKQTNNPLKHMYYVPLPVTISSDVFTKNITDEGPHILMIGKYHQERKKHLLFLQALNKLKTRYRFTATVVGECVSEEQRLNFKIIKHAVNVLELGDRITLQQNVPYNKMPELYASHQIFVLPAINEPYSISVIEAMGYGLPVICTDSCGAKFHIANGNNGYVIKSNNLDELTNALEMLMSDYHRLHQMQMKSLQYARKNLSADIFYKKFAHLISDRFSIAMN